MHHAYCGYGANLIRSLRRFDHQLRPIPLGCPRKAKFCSDLDVTKLLLLDFSKIRVSSPSIGCRPTAHSPCPAFKWSTSCQRPSDSPYLRCQSCWPPPRRENRRSPKLRSGHYLVWRPLLHARFVSPAFPSSGCCPGWCWHLCVESQANHTSASFLS